MSSRIEETISPEIAAVRKLRHSIGIDRCDPLAELALAEYAKRYAAGLLCDAKDYSMHANRKEVSAADVRLALTLSDTKIDLRSPSYDMSFKVFNEVNSKPLPDISNNDGVVFHRIPGIVKIPQEVPRVGNNGDNATCKAKTVVPSAVNDVNFLMRTFTFVPGGEAYPPPREATAPSTGLRDGSMGPPTSLGTSRIGGPGGSLTKRFRAAEGSGALSAANEIPPPVAAAGGGAAASSGAAGGGSRSLAPSAAAIGSQHTIQLLSREDREAAYRMQQQQQQLQHSVGGGGAFVASSGSVVGGASAGGAKGSGYK